MRKYRINVQNENVDFSFYTNVELNVHDAIVFNHTTFFLSEKSAENEFKAYRVGQVVHAFDSNPNM